VGGVLKLNTVIRALREERRQLSPRDQHAPEIPGGAPDASEQKFRKLFDSSLDSIAINSFATGVYLDINKEFERLSGYVSAEVLGKTSGQLKIWATRETYKEVLQILGNEGAVRNHEAELRRKDGSTVWVLLSAVRIDLDGEPRVVSYVRDITERKRAKEELTRAKDEALQANRLKSVFLSNMSHEIRTPLNVILGVGSFVEEHLTEMGDDSQKPYFDTIRRASGRLLDTIGRILDLSKMDTKGFEIRPVLVDVATLAEQHLNEFEPVAKEKGIRLTSRIDVNAVISFDQYCLSRSLTQLLDNAIKFTPDGGKVSVRLYRAPFGPLLLEVADTGVGIDAAYLSRLFEPFSQEDSGDTRRFDGSGLGLTLVKRYLELNGARMAVESHKGKGSIFQIQFAPQPAHEGLEAQNRLRRGRQSSAEQLKPTILLVEDDPDTQFLMKRRLSGRCSVVVASSGDEFRDQLAAYGADIDLVLMDLSLDGEEDGLTLARELRRQEQWKDLPVIAVTAHAFCRDRDQALEAGCDEYVSKPIDMQELLQKMWKLIRVRTRPRSLVTPAPSGNSTARVEHSS
jgi:two-component system, sensor histidine kinase and response regulator